MNLQSASRNTALDGLRGLAALSVIFYHSLLHREDLIGSVLVPSVTQLQGCEALLEKLFLSLVNGNSAVLLFFTLSGFVLARSLNRATGSFVGIVVNFTVSRIFRLYPALLFCMAAYYALSWLYAWAGWIGMPHPNLNSVLLNASLLKITWHGPSNTLQGEMLAIPFLLFSYAVGRRWGAAGLFCCLAYVVLAFENPQMLIWELPNMSNWLPAFVIGTLIADRRLEAFFQGVSGGALNLLLAVFLGLRMFTNMNQATNTLVQTLLCAALVGFVYYAAPQLRFIRFLNLRPVQFLGRISYSLYLLNVLALLVVWSVVDKTDLYQQYPLPTAIVVGLAATILTLPLAAWSQRCFEEGGVRLWQAIRAQGTLRTSNV